MDLVVTERMKNVFKSNQPFPFFILDGFWDEENLNKVLEEIQSIPRKIWLDHCDPTSNEMIFQQKKMSLNNPKILGEETRKLMEFFSSPEAIHYFEELTGIKDLIADPTYLGGGIHRISKGGKLSIHADFNIHPDLNLHRRLNVILYLNKDYKPEYQGLLELWNRNMTRCVTSVTPCFNRMIIFKITDDAYHGHPEPWQAEEDNPRLSLAFYYYTKDRPENEKAPFHWANWKSRPEKGF